jgi:hypothetical protein
MASESKDHSKAIGSNAGAKWLKNLGEEVFSTRLLVKALQLETTVSIVGDFSGVSQDARESGLWRRLRAATAATKSVTPQSTIRSGSGVWPKSA